MNVALRTVLVRSAFVASGAVAGAGGTVALTSGAHESVRMTLGDSIVPKFSVRTDTVLKVVGSNIVANKCGNSMVFLRTFYRGAQLTADSISVEVSCAPLPPVAVNSVEVCFSPVDSLDKYNVVKYDSLGRPLSLDARGDSLVHAWGCGQKPDTIFLDTTKVAPSSLTRKA